MTQVDDLARDIFISLVNSANEKQIAEGVGNEVSWFKGYAITAFAASEAFYQHTAERAKPPTISPKFKPTQSPTLSELGDELA